MRAKRAELLVVYDEAWNETAELLNSDKVNNSELEQSGMSGDKIKSREVIGSEAEKSEVKDPGMESSEIEESETEGQETEESDHFEDCNYMLEITPTFHVNVTDF